MYHITCMTNICEIILKTNFDTGYLNQTEFA